MSDQTSPASELPVELARLPKLFSRYPTAGGVLHGEVNVDLGEWLVEGRVHRFHMRILGSELPDLIANVMTKRGCEMRFGFGAIQVFKVADADDLHPEAVRIIQQAKAKE